MPLLRSRFEVGELAREQAAALAPEEEVLDGARTVQPVTIASASFENEAGAAAETETSEASADDTTPFAIDGELEVIRPSSTADGAKLVVFTHAGHPYVSRDAGAGLRTYPTKADENGRKAIKAIWFGGLAMLSHDNRTGGVVGAHVRAEDRTLRRKPPAPTVPVLWRRTGR